MIINTTTHISDMADSINLQTEREQQLKLQDFINGLPTRVFDGEDRATNDTYGVVLLSSKIESSESIITNKLFSGFEFNELATTNKYGRVVMASQDNIMTEEENTKTINPSTLKYFIANKTATENEYGFIKSVNDKSLNSYIDNDVAVTVDNLSYGMDYMIPKFGMATIYNTGTVKIVSTEDLVVGKLSNGYTVSPKKFHGAISTEKRYGLIKHSNDSDMGKYSETTSMTTDNLTNYVEKFDDMNFEISSLESVVATNRKNQESYIRDEINKIIGNYSSTSLYNYIRVGDLVYSLRRESNRSGEYAVPLGQFLSSTEYSKLFSIIGYTYGRSGNNFRVPDLRGLYFRHNGRGEFITQHEKYRVLGVPDPVFGVVQRQMVAKHKHGGNWSDQSKWGSSFGHTGNWGWYGSRGEQWGCHAMYQSDGGEIIAMNGIRDYPNPEGMINNDNETRPWTMATNIYMRIK